jgi:hypothetical protein
MNEQKSFLDSLSLIESPAAGVKTGRMVPSLGRFWVESFVAMLSNGESLILKSDELVAEKSRKKCQKSVPAKIIIKEKKNAHTQL